MRRSPIAVTVLLVITITAAGVIGVRAGQQVLESTSALGYSVVFGVLAAGTTGAAIGRAVAWIYERTIR